MALHLRILKKNPFYNARPNFRLYSGTIENVGHAHGTQQSSDKVRPAAQDRLATSLCEYAQAPLQTLVHGGFRLRDTMCGSLLKAKQAWLQDQINEIQSQMDKISITSYTFQDTSLLDPSRLPISRDHDDHPPVTPKPQTSRIDDLLSHLIEKKYAQQYTYNSDDIIFNQINADVESSQQTYDKSLMDKHFNVQTNSHHPYQSITNLLQEHKEKCNEKNEDLLEAYFQNSDPYGLQYGLTEEVFDRYSDDRDTEFPAFHVDINTPQFTGATSLPSPGGGVFQSSSSPLGPCHVMSMSTLDSDSPEPTVAGPDPSKTNQKPDLDQLMKLQEHIVEKMPKFFVEKHDYRCYRVDLVFENNYNPYRPRVTKDVSWYVIEVFKIRGWSAAKFVNTELNVLKATSHEDEGVVKVHWRFRGLPQLEVVKVWNFVPWKYRQSLNKESEYYEGISTFHVDGNGVIFKHVIDRTLPIHEHPHKKSLRQHIREKLRSYLRLPAPVLGGTATYKYV